MLENHTPIHKLSEGDEIIQFFMVKKSETKQARNGSWFLDLVLADKTGEINAKLWDQQPDAHLQYQVGTIIKVKARVDKFQDNLQLQIQKIRPAAPDDGVEAHDLVKTSPVPTEELWETLHHYIQSIESPGVRNIVNHLVQEKGEAMKTWPAAKNFHHNYFSGLLYHTCNMLKLAEQCLRVYPFLNQDLLIGGVILHDLGKISEMEAEMGMVKDYSTRGKMIGHITEAILWVERAASELGIDGEEVMLLQHMIASHHGKMEYGSPVTPKIPEAEVLHWLDMMDSRMGAVEDAILTRKPGESWTERIRILGTEMYKSDHAG
ncbi:MAG: HD domain-containing protein [Bacillaceae bacterium]|nr:HD domain-containing protein [Bacillaceae bacterium]